MQQSKALFICILLVPVRKLISAKRGGTAYLTLFILPEHVHSGALENTPVINFKTLPIKQLKYGCKNLLKNYPIILSSLYSPLSCLAALAQNLSTCRVQGGMVEVCPSKRDKSDRNTGGGWVRRLLWISVGQLAKPPHTAHIYNGTRMTCHHWIWGPTTTTACLEADPIQTAHELT